MEQSTSRKYVNFMSVPSLRSMTLVYIATKVCKQEDVKVTSKPSNFKFLFKDRQRIDNRALKKRMFQKLFPLNLPQSLIPEIIAIVNPISYKISDSTDKQLHWTMNGAVDELKRFESRLFDRLPVNAVFGNFQTFCTRCLQIWIDYMQHMLFQCTQSSINSNNHPLIKHWTGILDNLRQKSVACYNRRHNYSHICKIVHQSILNGNVLAVKYFWCKLPGAEKEGKVMGFIKKAIQAWNFPILKTSILSDKQCDITFFLLSQMSDDQQDEAFRTYSKEILNMLLYYWPYRRFLLPTIRLMWYHLDAKLYMDLLYNMVRKRRHPFRGLFRTLWNESPANLKQSFFDNVARHGKGEYILLRLLVIDRDLVTVRLILHSAVGEEPKNIVHTVCSEDLCMNIVPYDVGLVDHILMMLSEYDCKFRRRMMKKFGIFLYFQWIRAN